MKLKYFKDIRQGPQNNQRFFNQQTPQNLQQLQQQLSPQQYYPEQQQSSDYFGGGSFLPQQQQQRNQYGNDYDRPLTIRDFERILQVLVHRQQSPQFRVNPFYPSSNPLGYPPFIPGGYNSQNPYSQIPRPPFFNNPNPLSSGFYDPGYQNPYYSPSMPVGQQADAMQDQNQENPQQQQRFPQQRRRQFNSRFLTQQQQQQQTQLASPPVAPSEQEFSYNSLQGPPMDSFLPPSVREQLLYRMLMLALRSESQQLPQQQHVQPLMPSASSMHSVLEPEQQETKTLILKSTSERTSVSKKPVRSVQIIGEETEDDEEE